MHRHEGIAWANLRTRIEGNPDALRTLREMQATGGLRHRDLLRGSDGLREVGPEFAATEGEGDGSLEYCFRAPAPVA
jgi:hypothetical protein